MFEFAQLRRLLLFHFALFVCCLGILVASDPVIPLADLPNHLARAFIIHNIDRSPPLAEAYRVVWQFTPYFVMEVTLDLLQYIMPVYAAGKVFIGLCLAVVVLGVLAVNRAINGQPSFTTLLAYPLFFGQVFAFGFLNFILGTGIALLSYAWWLKNRGRAMPDVKLFLVFNLNFFVHPFSYGILVAIIFLREAFETEPQGQRARLKRCGWILLLALPQLAYWVLIPRDVAGTEDAFSFGSITLRPFTALMPFLLHVTPVSVLFPLFLLSAIYLACRHFKLVTIDRVHLAILIALTIVSLFVPEKIFGISFLDLRIPFVTSLLLISVARVGKLGTVGGRMLKTAVIGLAAFRLIWVFPVITACSSQIEELRTALATYLTIPAVPLLAIQEFPTGSCGALPLSYSHVSSLAVIESQAYVPLVFTVIPPIKAAARYKDLDPGVYLAYPPDLFFSPPSRNTFTYLRNWEQKFNYVLWLHFGRKDHDVPKSMHLLADRRDFAIFEIIPSQVEKP